MAAFFISIPKRELTGFVHDSDREFFSVPVEVVPVCCDINTKVLTVWSPLQGHDVVYPVNREVLRTEFQLMRRQRDAARRIPSPLNIPFPRVER